MPPRSVLRAFLALWIGTGLVLLVLSLATVRFALLSFRVHVHESMLGGIEAVGALLFLVPRTLRAGAVLLLLAISYALAVHLAMLRFRADLIVYGLAVLFVAVHGPLTREQLREALGLTPPTSGPAA